MTIESHFTPEAVAEITDFQFDPSRFYVAVSWTCDGVRFWSRVKITDDYKITDFVRQTGTPRDRTRALWHQPGPRVSSSERVPDRVDVEHLLQAMRAASRDGAAIREAAEAKARERAEREAEAIRLKAEFVVAKFREHLGDSVVARMQETSDAALAAFYDDIQNGTI